MELDADRLRVLVEVAHAGSIAEAARRLSFTPSALSQQLTRLEKEVGARLLERRSNGVVPTEVGVVLLDHAERVLGELRDASAAVREAMGAAPQRLAIGTFSTAGQVLAPAALSALQRRHPDVELSFVDLEPPLGYGLVTSGELDVLITHRYPGVAAVSHPGLVHEPLLTEPLLIAAPARRGLSAAARGLDLRDLADETWIAGAPGVANRTCLLTLTDEVGYLPRVAYETSDYLVALALVAAGLGLALIPQTLLVQADRRRVSVHRVRGRRPARQISVVHRRRLTPLVRELIALLHDSADAVTPRPGS